MGDVQTNLRASIQSQPFFLFFSHMTLCEEGRWEEGMEGLAFEPGSGMPSGMKLGSEAKNSYLRNQPAFCWTSLVFPDLIRTTWIFLRPSHCPGSMKHLNLACAGNEPGSMKRKASLCSRA